MNILHFSFPFNTIIFAVNTLPCRNRWLRDMCHDLLDGYIWRTRKQDRSLVYLKLCTQIVDDLNTVLLKDNLIHSFMVWNLGIAAD